MGFDITYGICSGGDNTYLETLITSIKTMHEYPNTLYNLDAKYEIIVESGPEWLPAKKNSIAAKALYPNLCIVHDYYKFPRHWFEYTATYSETNYWDILNCEIVTLEGKRSADWMINPYVIDDAIKVYPVLGDILRRCAPHENGPRFVNALPYNEDRLTKFQYISGGYILCKRSVLRDIQFNTDMLPGSPEDVEWSERVMAARAVLKFNPWTRMSIQKPGKWAVTEMPSDAITILKEYNDNRLFPTYHFGS